MEKLLSIIVPAYNESDHIEAILAKLAVLQLPDGYGAEIVVVDDGSRDDTAQKIEQFIQAHNTLNICLLRHERNQGKGMAIRTGLQEVTGLYTVIQDGDTELDPNDFAPMLRKMLDENLSVLYGSRFLGKERKAYIYRSFYFGTRVLSGMVNLLYNQNITDEATCYKMFRTDLIKSIPLTCMGFEFCPEVTAKVCRRGYKIQEVPISYVPRSIEQGKKIRSRDGFKAMWTLLKYWFVPYEKV